MQIYSFAALPLFTLIEARQGKCLISEITLLK